MGLNQGHLDAAGREGGEGCSTCTDFVHACMCVQSLEGLIWVVVPSLGVDGEGEDVSSDTLDVHYQCLVVLLHLIGRQVQLDHLTAVGRDHALPGADNKLLHSTFSGHSLLRAAAPGGRGPLVPWYSQCVPHGDL